MMTTAVLYRSYQAEAQNNAVVEVKVKVQFQPLSSGA